MYGRKQQIKTKEQKGILRMEEREQQLQEQQMTMILMIRKKDSIER